MAKGNRVILCVGSPGNGRNIILEHMRKLVNFSSYHMIDHIVEEGSIDNVYLNKNNFLDFYESNPEHMEKYHKNAIEKIMKEIQKYPGTHIISTSLHFEWKGNRFKCFYEEEVLRLNPDMIVIIYDDVFRVRERLAQDNQWKNAKFTLGEIANWRREEIRLAYYFARLFKPRVEVQLVAFENGPAFFKNVIWSYGREKVYLSHPITGEGETFLKSVIDFGYTLSEYYIVFNPAISKDWNLVEGWREAVNESIEKGEHRPSKFRFSVIYKDRSYDQEIEALDLEAAMKNIRFQVIDTDYRLIENSSMVIVYHPRASISAGVMCEMIYAKSLGKLVYVYYPYEPSLFFEYYSTRIFTDKEELQIFLIKESKLSVQKPLDIFYARK